mgnify:CR=1 FL=1
MADLFNGEFGSIDKAYEMEARGEADRQKVKSRLDAVNKTYGSRAKKTMDDMQDGISSKKLKKTDGTQRSRTASNFN